MLRPTVFLAAAALTLIVAAGGRAETRAAREGDAFSALRQVAGAVVGFVAPDGAFMDRRMTMRAEGLSPAIGLAMSSRLTIQRYDAVRTMTLPETRAGAKEAAVERRPFIAPGVAMPALAGALGALGFVRLLRRKD